MEAARTHPIRLGRVPSRLYSAVMRYTKACTVKNVPAVSIVIPFLV